MKAGLKPIKTKCPGSQTDLIKQTPRSKLIWKKIVQNISHFVVKYLKFIARKLPPKTKDTFLLLGWESFAFTGAPSTICKVIQFWNIKHKKDKENCTKYLTFCGEISQIHCHRLKIHSYFWGGKVLFLQGRRQQNVSLYNFEMLNMKKTKKIVLKPHQKYFL